MPNTVATQQAINRYLRARVPFVAVRSRERSRVLPLLRELAQERHLDIAAHTLTRGVYHLTTDKVLVTDRSLWSALEYAGEQFQKRSGLTVVFTDVQRISDDNEETRHLRDLIATAEDRDCCVMVITADPVWSALQEYGMTVSLDPLDYDELVKLAHDVIDPYRARPDFRVEWTEDEFHEAAALLGGVTRTQAVNLLSVMLADKSVSRADLPKLSSAKDAIFSDLSGIERVSVRPTDQEVCGLRGLTDWLDRRRSLLTRDLRDRGMRPPRGVLLVGVPGCGKSLSAKAVSARWGLPLYRLDMGSIVGMYYGQSEGRLRSALNLADQVAPCVLWIDEIEKAFATRSDLDNPTTTRLLGQFLYWLQESQSGAFIVATANNVDALPPELLRKGRFDELFFIDLPSVAERREIIALYLSRYLRIAQADESLMSDLVHLSEGFSGAEIDAAVRQVADDVLLDGATNVDPSALAKSFADTVPFARSQPEALQRLRRLRDRTRSASG
jgi:ATPase family associated with various cellular activities (AAA)